MMLGRRRSLKSTGLWSEDSKEGATGFDREQFVERIISRTLGKEV
jgi:hypothetical protein